VCVCVFFFLSSRVTAPNIFKYGGLSFDVVLQKRNEIPNMADMRLTQEQIGATRFGTAMRNLLLYDFTISGVR
jgi:hypothetical protein